MEKYGTYYIFRNVVTKELKRVPYTQENIFEKYASSEQWELLENEPEENLNDKK